MPRGASLTADGSGMSVVDYCRDALQRRVLAGSLLPGEQIRQEDMSVQLGVSRTPLRQALSVLASEGFIDHVPNVGFFIAKVSPAQMSEVATMRQALEKLLFDSLDIDALDFERLSQLAGQIEEAATNADIYTMTALNKIFHFTIFEASPLSITIDFVNRLWMLTESYRPIYSIEASARQRMVDEHRQMLEALRSRDLATAFSVAEAHRGQAFDSLISYVTSREATGDVTRLALPPMGRVTKP